MNLIPFIIIFAFSCLWSAITNKYLPSETLDKKGIKIDMMKDNVKCLLKYLLKVLFGSSIVCYLHCCLDLQGYHQALKEVGFLSIQKFSL